MRELQTRKLNSEFSLRLSVSASAAQVVTSLPTVESCSNTYSIRQAQQECYTREGLQFNLPDVTWSKQTYLNAILTNTDTLQELCSDFDAYQRASVCASQTALQCLTSDYTDYFPSAINIRRSLSMECDTLNVTNISCLKSVASRLYDCGYNKGFQYGLQTGSQMDRKDFLCFAYAANAECQLEVFPTCGCPTTHLYVQMSKLYLNPPACSRITVKTPACDNQTQQFIDRGATMLKRMTLLVLSGLVLCALRESTLKI